MRPVLSLPRTFPDGSYNRFFVQRLKDKAGNKSNASSEIEYAGTLAIRVGEVGRGIREILSHAHLTRLDFAIGLVVLSTVYSGVMLAVRAIFF